MFEILYSSKTIDEAPNVLVSITWQPASRNELCTCSTILGEDKTKFSLQPSKSSPPKWCDDKFKFWKEVPVPPSKIIIGLSSLFK